MKRSILPPSPASRAAGRKKREGLRPLNPSTAKMPLPNRKIDFRVKNGAAISREAALSVGGEPIANVCVSGRVSAGRLDAAKGAVKEKIQKCEKEKMRQCIETNIRVPIFIVGTGFL